MVLWAELTPFSRVYLCEYNVAGFGPTNSLAFPCPGGLAVLSPPSAPTPAHFAFFEDPENRLVAIIAPHSGHTVGLGPWSSHFPEVPIFAPFSSISVILDKVGKELKQPVAPLEELQGKMNALGAGNGYRVELREVYKSNNGSIAVLCLPLNNSGQSILYSDEYVPYFTLGLFTRLNPADSRFAMNCDLRPFEFLPWVMGQLFWWSGCIPGLKVNRLFQFFLVEDYKAMTGALGKALDECEEAAGGGGTIVVPSHGFPMRSKDEVDGFRRLLKEWS
jgi:hypothetical protein